MLNVLEKQVHVGEGLVLASPVHPVWHWEGLGYPKGRVQHGTDSPKTALKKKKNKNHKAKEGSRAPRLAAGAGWWGSAP